jgi:type II secretory ATPase GspE/PulE/Tfp pilus assembly ATPase PilB-like protein
MGSGYTGRAAVYEIMEVDNTIRRMIVSGQSEVELHEHLQKNQVRSLWQEGKEKVNEGVIDAASAERVIGRIDGLTQL